MQWSVPVVSGTSWNDTKMLHYLNLIPHNGVSPPWPSSHQRYDLGTWICRQDHCDQPRSALRWKLFHREEITRGQIVGPIVEQIPLWPTLIQLSPQQLYECQFCSPSLHPLSYLQRKFYHPGAPIIGTNAVPFTAMLGSFGLFLCNRRWAKLMVGRNGDQANVVYIIKYQSADATLVCLVLCRTHDIPYGPLVEFLDTPTLPPVFPIFPYGKIIYTLRHKPQPTNRPTEAIIMFIGRHPVLVSCRKMHFQA